MEEPKHTPFKRKPPRWEKTERYIRVLTIEMLKAISDVPISAVGEPTQWQRRAIVDIYHGWHDSCMQLLDDCRSNAEKMDRQTMNYHARMEKARGWNIFSKGHAQFLDYVVEAEALTFGLQHADKAPSLMRKIDMGKAQSPKKAQQPTRQLGAAMLKQVEHKHAVFRASSAAINFTGRLTREDRGNSDGQAR